MFRDWAHGYSEISVQNRRALEPYSPTNAEKLGREAAAVDIVEEIIDMLPVKCVGAWKLPRVDRLFQSDGREGWVWGA